MSANAMGQPVNPTKFSMLVGRSCPDVTRDEVKNILQITLTGFEEKCLGLPTPDGRMSKGKFQNLQVKLSN